MMFLDVNLTQDFVARQMDAAASYIPPAGKMQSLFDVSDTSFVNDVCCSDKTGYWVFDKPLSSFNISGHMVYGPNGYMTWHTNSNKPGRRIYAAWSENGESGMLWWKNGRIVIDQDKPGWNVRSFVVPSWHAVWSKCYRLSVGASV